MMSTSASIPAALARARTPTPTLHRRAPLNASSRCVELAAGHAQPVVGSGRGFKGTRLVGHTRRGVGSTGRVVMVRAAGEGEDVNDSNDASPSSSSFDPPWSAPGYRGAVVSSFPEPAQAAAVLGVWAGIGALTVFACSTVGPAVNDAFPGYMAWSRSTWPVLGLTYIAAGIAHFGVHQGFVDMFPHRGAWGFFSLPGSPSFHVNWTGVAEILGGLGIASALLPIDTPEWVVPASSWGIFLLTIAVTPANTYMWTHNAPGPLPEDADESMAVLPWYGHLTRGLLQVLLLSITWGLAHPPGN